MRTIISGLVVSLALLSTSSQASERFDTEKVKTGILPSGGFYSLYEVDCGDQSTVLVASLNSNRRWCISASDDMSCFSRRQEASTRACMSGALASADDSVKGDGG